MSLLCKQQYHGFPEAWHFHVHQKRRRRNPIPLTQASSLVSHLPEEANGIWVEERHIMSPRIYSAFPTVALFMSAPFYNVNSKRHYHETIREVYTWSSCLNPPRKQGNGKWRYLQVLLHTLALLHISHGLALPSAFSLCTLLCNHAKNLLIISQEFVVMMDQRQGFKVSGKR